MTKTDAIAARRAEVLRRLYYSVPTPSRRELADALDVSPGTIHSDVMNLERLGFVQRRPGMARAVTITEIGARHARARR